MLQIGCFERSISTIATVLMLLITDEYDVERP